MERKIVICDIDGTIANVQHRLHYIKNPKEAELRERIASLSKIAPNIPAEAQQEIESWKRVLKRELLSFSKDWDWFHKACVDDEPYEDVIEVLHSLGLSRSLSRGREVYFFSGRNASVRRETIEWLEKHVPITRTRWSYSDEVRNSPDYDPDFPISAEWHKHLRMRSENDRRPDTVVKLEMMQELGFTPKDVLCILDDRQSVVDMWRQNGFRVMQVAAWKE